MVGSGVTALAARRQRPSGASRAAIDGETSENTQGASRSQWEHVGNMPLSLNSDRGKEDVMIEARKTWMPGTRPGMTPLE
jgi:hypothetical protein